MVVQADLLLACYDGKDGGTKHTVEFAERMDCEVRLIPPVKRKKITDWSLFNRNCG